MPLKPIKPKAKPFKIGPSEQLLRDELNKQDYNEMIPYKGGLELPDVDHAPPFRQEPLVIGQPSTARTVDDILKIAPELRGHTNRIMVGPDEGAIKNLGRFKFRPEEYTRTNLMGTTNPYRHNEISLNPKLQPSHEEDDNSELLKYLTHELSHTRGFDDSSESNPNSAYRIQEMYPKSLKRGKTFDEIVDELNEKFKNSAIHIEKPIGPSRGKK